MRLGSSRVAVVVAHPDDEVIGCGGTIARLADEGAQVRVLLPVRRSDPRGIEHWAELLSQFHASCALLGAEVAGPDPTLFEHLAETDLRALHEIVAPTVDWADSVLTHFGDDVHQMHRAVSRAVEIATRPFRRRCDVDLFETATSTDQGYRDTFAPQAFVTLTGDQADRKLRAMELYATEAAPGRAAEDLERRLRFRGAQIGTTWAEAFVVARQFR